MTDLKIPHSARSFAAAELFCNPSVRGDVLLLYPDEEEAIKAHKQISFYHPEIPNHYFPGLDTIPYDRVSPNQHLLAKRAETLTILASNKDKKLVITQAANLLNKLPAPATISKACLKLTKGMKYSMDALTLFLAQNGFNRSVNAIDSGEFAVRGEIIDLVLPNLEGWRINFAWDQIGSIKKYDTNSQISVDSVNELLISLVSEVILNPATINNFKDNFLKIFGINYARLPIYESLIEGIKFPAYEQLLPLFYPEVKSLLDYLQNPVIMYDNLCIQAILEQESSYIDLYQSRIQSNKLNPLALYPALPVEQVCVKSEEIKACLEAAPIHPYLPPAVGEWVQLRSYLIQRELLPRQDLSFINERSRGSQNSWVTLGNEDIFELIVHHGTKIPIICTPRGSKLERLKALSESIGYKYQVIEELGQAKAGVINFSNISLEGFITDKYLFIGDQDIFGPTGELSKGGSQRKLKEILIELDNLTEGELIVHKEHGIGQFITVENIQVNGNRHDFLKILYAGNDKLYIPVENIQLIKKHGSNEVELDKLGSLSWQKRKAKLKNRISFIAEKLIKITASRKVANVMPVEFDQDQYNKFCNGFNYVETTDQIRAIEEIRTDLTSGILMDRLICGDVGFGKTEVAMRAVYMVASNQQLKRPQIAIIVPTTILCKQHYSRFLERFDKSGLKIVQLSRLVKAATAKRIKQQIKSGEVDIVIGTHALLGSDIEFHNLQLLVIDEEHHFGVDQKEKLKSLKTGVHVLALSATPIPRTLQMSMVGIKDLSLIATPPIDRLAIRTTIMPFDAIIIRDALLRERLRGGKSFYVCPRIKDIIEVEKFLKEMVPTLKYKIAHGQMAPGLVDEVMDEFYEGKFDILLSTTIIESGIDIATANTMVIHKADMLGLSQLYQLRGRIGRSKVRGYAYLTLAKNKLLKHAIKRLEVVQSIDTLGAGFTIASHDMDLRGFGNLVGEEQSGHIREVGVELYQEMLDNAIAELRNEAQAADTFVPNINLNLPIFIADDYIADPSLRLGIYRRIGNLVNSEEVEKFRDEMVDRFGPIPPEFNNLLDIVKIRQLCSQTGIENLDGGPQGFAFKFYPKADVREMVIKFISEFPRHAKIKPDNKLMFIKPVNQINMIAEVNSLISALQKCKPVEMQ